MERSNVCYARSQPHNSQLLAAAARLPLATQDVTPAELVAAVREGSFDAQAHEDLQDRGTRLTLSVMCADAGSTGARCQLHVSLPPGYPSSAAARVLAVSSEQLSREQEAGCVQRLQQAACSAAGAAGVGQECLCQVVEALLSELAAAAREARAASAGAAAACREQQQEQEQYVALLRLDHMHDPRLYRRTLRRWAAELRLSGRLLVSGGGGERRAAILLLLLHGEEAAVRDFVLRMRTRNVDVDSKGRPCRERMMDVLRLAPRSGGGAGNSGGGAASSCIEGYCEEEVGVPQLAALLRAAGLEELWGAATSLPGPVPQ